MSDNVHPIMYMVSLLMTMASHVQLFLGPVESVTQTTLGGRL